MLGGNCGNGVCGEGSPGIPGQSPGEALVSPVERMTQESHPFLLFWRRISSQRGQRWIRALDLPYK